MIAALLVLTQAAPAPQTGATVTVTARRRDEAKAVRHMTAKVTPVVDASQPLARFAAPVCPEVDGLPPALDARFVARMRDDAVRAGLTVDADKCTPNVTVLFVPNGQDVVRALHKTQPRMFGALEPAQIRRIAADPGPVHLWSFTELRSRDDDRPRQGTTVPGKDAPEMQVRNASIIESSTRVVVDGVIMLVDQQASVGKSIDQLADYAAMRALAQARPIGDAAAEPTILRLFDTAEATHAKGLTAFDAAYLKAMYRGALTALGLTRVGTMAREINKSLAAAVVETKPVE